MVPLVGVLLLLLLLRGVSPVCAPPSSIYDPAHPDKMPRPLSNAAFGAVARQQQGAATAAAAGPTDADCLPFQHGPCEIHGCYWSAESHTCYKKHIPGSDGTYAQNYQDWWVRKVAEHNGWTKAGYFLDLGAHSGVWCSNTRLLEERFGWHGICVEPFPENGPTAGSFRNRSCVLIPRALTGQGSLDGTTIEMEIGADAQSTRVVTTGGGSQMRDAYGGQQATLMSIGALLRCPSSSSAACCANASRFGKTPLATTSSSGDGDADQATSCSRTLWSGSEIPKFLNFVSLDVEGLELDVLRGFPFGRVTVGAWVIEHNHQAEKRQAIVSVGSLHPHTLRVRVQLIGHL